MFVVALQPQTPRCESKKVTFGLTNNKTAGEEVKGQRGSTSLLRLRLHSRLRPSEFRKSDRSLLVSPDGSSRVPFDPRQKPKVGVLKPAATPLAARARSRRSAGTPQRAAKRRPTAADFF